ncbi:hypothetical protein DFQ01_14443 [Paenibacillus cellulosilyticus]|uniref:Uncharacterized protein n=1 Tax=Paenibacillus cellulosilyticus TaxID=375489 RepID=A0A2V2YE18_9BACL|nr:hypothetical protein [Paenibacillus cellulosilyticus]PWV90267.1 hypothetical protein DFQ01_14443 [Paenibacillus cellulosilyticus]QKS43425.1 hypothetical protein HUB94_02570 [Paenibacillus cellulosilyticus]
MGAIYSGTTNRSNRAEQDFSGGLNNGLSTFDLKDNESAAEYGWDTERHPALTTRKGRSSYGAAGSGATRLMANFGNAYLVRAVGSTLQYDNAGTWTNITGTWADADWDATNFNDLLLLVNGTQLKKWNGTSLLNISGSPPAGAKYITNDNVRVWMAVGDVLYYSAFQDQDDWTSAENSGSVQYYTPNGGDITGLKEFYGDKWVWKKDSMAVIKGTNYYNYALVSVSNDIGCISSRTIVEVGDTIYWLGENDIYGHQGGKPFAIGERVRGHLNNLNRGALERCCAFTDGIRYYLCIATGEYDEPNVRLMYDPRFNIWREVAHDESYRYAGRINNQTYVGDANGQTYKINDGTDDNGAAIPWSIVTKVFDEGYAEAEKQYKELHLQGTFPVDTSLTVEYSTDQGLTWTTIAYNPAGGADIAQSRNMIIPLDTLPLTNFAQFRLSGVGPAEIQKMQRYFKVCRVQR